MKSLDSTALADMLEKDYIGRNAQIETVMRFINSIDNKLSPVLAIDSPWGSGKTVFMQQLDLINNDDSIQPSAIDPEVSKAFKKKNNVYYFNAWENDYIDDPLQAIIFNLIKDIDTQGLQANAMKRALKGVDIAAFIKNITKDGIDISTALEPDATIKDISEILDRKERIRELIKAYIQDTGRRFVFIIDELDRCKPSFAVNLLEAIKHYFTDENIIFIAAVDTSQLVHTVKKYYGEGFDGATYLNRFFDYNVSLVAPDKEKYLTNYLGVKNDRYWVRLVPKDIAEHLDMSMREIETYLNALDLLSGYMSRSQHWHDETMAIFTQYIFTPFALALKIHQPAELGTFVKGRNATILKNLVLSSDEIQGILQRYVEDKQNFTPQKAADFAVSLYTNLFFKKGDYDLKQTRERTLEVTSLISRYSTIKELSSGDSDD